MRLKICPKIKKIIKEKSTQTTVTISTQAADYWRIAIGSLNTICLANLHRTVEPHLSIFEIEKRSYSFQPSSILFFATSVCAGQTYLYIIHSASVFRLCAFSESGCFVLTEEISWIFKGSFLEDICVNLNAFYCASRQNVGATLSALLVVIQLKTSRRSFRKSFRRSGTAAQKLVSIL